MAVGQIPNLHTKFVKLKCQTLIDGKGTGVFVYVFSPLMPLFYPVDIFHFSFIFLGFSCFAGASVNKESLPGLERVECSSLRPPKRLMHLRGSSLRFGTKQANTKTFGKMYPFALKCGNFLRGKKSEGGFKKIMAFLLYVQVRCLL